MNISIDPKYCALSKGVVYIPLFRANLFRPKQQQAEVFERQQIRRETLTHPAIEWTQELFPEADVTVRPLPKTEE